jgi:hypothetical protein
VNAGSPFKRVCHRRLVTHSPFADSPFNRSGHRNHVTHGENAGSLFYESAIGWLSPMTGVPTHLFKIGIIMQEPQSSEPASTNNPQINLMKAFRDLAIEALEVNGQNMQDAIKWLQRSVIKQKHLSREIVFRACENEVGLAHRQRNEQIWKESGWTPPNHTNAGNGKRLLVMARANLLNWSLPSGPLRSAKKINVLSHAIFYETQARDMSWKSRWLKMIADKLDDEQTVEQVLSNDDLKELQIAAKEN